ncbi:MAG: DNA recombination/repair protein RecA, partial [Planctomycetota bacterium]
MAKAKKKATPETNSKQAALENALAGIARNFGEGAIMCMSDQSRKKIDVIPSGSLAVDVALGVG